MSITQADRVETLLKARGLLRNRPWRGRAAVASPTAPPVTLGSGMQITLLSPTPRELQPLVRKWEESRRTKGGSSIDDERDDNEPSDDRPAADGTDERPLYIASAAGDSLWRGRLLAALGPSVAQSQVFVDKATLEPGAAFSRELSRTRIEQARVAVVLVSRAALASPYLMQEELPALIKEAERGSLHLTWMLLEPCDWSATNLERFEALRSPGEPLAKLTDRELARAVTQVAARLTQLVNERASNPPASASQRHRGADDGPIDIEALIGRPYTPDRSVANNSSLAFLAELQGKAVLICGDASAEVLAASIRAVIGRRGQGRLRVDAFVVPHNGSARNLTRELLALLDCERYLISTNGSTFRHPDRETIARILAFGRSSPSTPLTLVFNYRSLWTDVWDNPELKARWNYQTVYPTGNDGGIKVQI
jgi:hypothetical protein